MLPQDNLHHHPAAARLKVFISYSRRDMEFADRLVAALEARGQEVIIDRRDLPLLEQWQLELQGFIRNADAVVFILSPASIGSKWCEWEVQEVTSLSKRMAPVVAVPISPNLRPPEAVARLNYVFFTPPHEFEEQADKLVKALNTNFGWVKEHTRLGELARRWNERGGPSGLLLHGSEIGEAERWAVARPREAPAPTDLHVAFIQASRRRAIRQQRIWIAGSTAVAVMALALAGFAYWQREAAVKNEVRAIAGEQLARDNERRAEQRRDEALTTQSQFLADLAQQALDSGKPVEGELLALAGLSDAQSQLARPYVQEAERAAYQSQLGQREIATLRGHHSGLIAALFSADGRRVATAAAASDNTVRLWDAEMGTTLAVLKGHTMPLTSVAFSPDGRRVVTTSLDATARLWDTETGAALAVLNGHEREVLSAVFSPDGSLVLTASRDNTARLWEAASGREVIVFRGHNVVEEVVLEGTMFRSWEEVITRSGVNSALFNADGKQVVTAGVDGTARVWDAKSGAALVVFDGHSSQVVVAAFSPDGKHVLTASGDATARLWDTKTGAQLATMRGHTGGLSTASFSADGSLIATTCEDNVVRLWDGATGKSLTVLKGHEKKVLMAAFIPDGNIVVSASEDRTARLWDVKTGAEIAVLSGHERPVHSAAFSADGHRLVTASDDRTARLWDAKPGVLRGHARILHTVFSADGARILAASSDSTARLWDVQSETVLRVFKGHESMVRSAAFGPGDRLVLTASVDNTARLWDSATGESKLIISGHENVKMPNPGQIAGTLAEQDPDYKIEGQDERGVTSAAFSPDGLRLVTSSFDRTARVWDANTGAPLVVLQGHDATVYSGGFSPDGSRIVTASQDGTARLWNARTGQEITVLKGHGRAVMGAMFSPDGSRVVTVSMDGTARIWDAKTGAHLIVLNHNEAVYWAAFSPNGGRLVTASGDGSAWLWDVATATVVGFLRGHTGAVSGVDFSPDGSRIVTASGNTARMWRAFQDTQGLVVHIKRAVPRCLSPAEREKAFLAPEPPRWCITGPGLEQEADTAKWMPKWPYETLEWRDWLVAADSARGKDLIAPPAPK